MDNIKYWEKRALLNLTESEKIGDNTSKVLIRMYNQAYKDLQNELNSIYKNYSNETGLDIQRLKTLLTKTETDKTWKALEKQGLTKYIKKNYKARINIIEQKQAQIYAKIKALHDLENPIMKRGFKGVINHSYYKTIYDLQQGTGLNLSFSKLNFKDVNKIANHNWSKVKFSTRALYNNNVLADEVVDIIGGALLSGQSFDKTKKQMKERFDVENYKLERLIRTESNYFHNESMAVASEDMGFKKYILKATLDERTSKICEEKNNKIYYYKDKKVGENFPPFHCFCRTLAVPYVNPDEFIKEREPVKEETFKEFLKNNDIISDNKKEESSKPIKKELSKKDIEALEYYVSGDGMYINNALRKNEFSSLDEFDKNFVKELDNVTNNVINEKVLYRSVDASAIFPNISAIEYEDLYNYVVYDDRQKLIVDTAQKVLNRQKKQFIDKGFVSTTKDFEIANEWGGMTGSEKPIVLELKLDKDVKGVDVTFLDLKTDEQKEILLARNQLFEIEEVTSKDGSIFVKAKVKNK